MLTREENDLLTRTGPGTPMGEVMRRYWLPAGLSWEVPEPDCSPVRVKLLGESLVMFRDSENRIGLLDEFCAHRGTSLWLGRTSRIASRSAFALATGTRLC
jgi:phenylpropionate dioxygenase-like ring-hydroxylating dioxygenase large terminal subunit